MKTFVPCKYILKGIVIVALFFNCANSSAQSTPAFVFKNPGLVSGTDLAAGSVYRFSKVKTGVDALVEIKSFVGGISLNEIDATGTGFDEAFQPFINSPAHSDGYVEFEIKFVITGTNSLMNQAEVPVTPIDIDGNASHTIFEHDELNLNGGYVNYDALGTELAVMPKAGNWFNGTNIGGIGYPGVDTTAKQVMFTVVNTNISSFKARIGTNNIGSSAEVRYRSVYFKKFIYPNSPLPIKLLSFSAVLNKNNVNLNWTTAEEINVNHFVIEKSLDGKNFSETGAVSANGNTTDEMHYNFTDNVNTGEADVIYYRLRSVDMDGKSEYSSTRMIRMNEGSGNKISILTYPNPVTNELRITIPANWQNKKVSYELFNANGQATKKTQTTASSQTETINVSNIASGFYIVRVACDGQIAKQKIIKN